MKQDRDIGSGFLPKSDGCEGCLASGGWWLHLRRCATCGYIGCCNSSPGQHAEMHARESGHSVAASFEPLQNWFVDFRTRRVFRSKRLPPPHSHPASQPVPGPAGRVPRDWESLLRDS
ncbi:MAG: UBP-type zinc finger domain-containing protein [Acidobacteria bacterium]|nr:UBP-type zinc finger domain-containing protein [Acidobacteriota bacterium]